MKVFNKIKKLFDMLFDFKGLLLFFSSNILKNMVLIFILIIFFPIFDNLINVSKEIDNSYISEYRIKEKRPIFSLKSVFPYFEKYEKYYNDNFSFRGFLISKFNKLKYSIFKSSPVKSVIIGKDGWLFLAEENGITFDKYYFSYKLFTKGELDLWKRRLEQRAELAKSVGCNYILMIVPNKQTVYPEMMPAGLTYIPKKSLMSQMVRNLSDVNNLTVIDLRTGFAKLKREKRIYQKTDTHWNNFGAYSAYRMLIKTISDFSGKMVIADSISDFNEIHLKKDGGDLARMLSFEKDEFRDRVIILDRKEKIKIICRESNIKGVSNVVLERRCSDGILPPMMFIHDSFGDYLMKFLPHHFNRSFYTMERDIVSLKSVILLGKVKFIVEEIAERHFLLSPFLTPNKL